MIKKNMLAAMICGITLCTVTGCGFFTPERVSRIHSTLVTALEIAYEAGGKELAAAKIAEMIVEGRITEEQGKLLFAAAQNGYEAFLARLNELTESAE